MSISEFLEEEFCCKTAENLSLFFSFTIAELRKLHSRSDQSSIDQLSTRPDATPTTKFIEFFTLGKENFPPEQDFVHIFTPAKNLCFFNALGRKDYPFFACVKRHAILTQVAACVQKGEKLFAEVRENKMKRGSNQISLKKQGVECSADLSSKEKYLYSVLILFEESNIFFPLLQNAISGEKYQSCQNLSPFSEFKAKASLSDLITNIISLLPPSFSELVSLRDFITTSTDVISPASVAHSSFTASLTSSSSSSSSSLSSSSSSSSSSLSPSSSSPSLKETFPFALSSEFFVDLSPCAWWCLEFDSLLRTTEIDALQEPVLYHVVIAAYLSFSEKFGKVALYGNYPEFFKDDVDNPFPYQQWMSFDGEERTIVSISHVMQKEAEGVVGSSDALGPEGVCEKDQKMDISFNNGGKNDNVILSDLLSSPGDENPSSSSSSSSSSQTPPSCPSPDTGPFRVPWKPRNFHEITSELDMSMPGHPFPDTDALFFVSVDSGHASRLVPRRHLKRIQELLREMGVVVLEKAY